MRLRRLLQTGSNSSRMQSNSSRMQSNSSRMQSNSSRMQLNSNRMQSKGNRTLIKSITKNFGKFYWFDDRSIDSMIVRLIRSIENQSNHLPPFCFCFFCFALALALGLALSLQPSPCLLPAYLCCCFLLYHLFCFLKKYIQNYHLSLSMKKSDN